jgi:hypothetical protein
MNAQPRKRILLVSKAWVQAVTILLLLGFLVMGVLAYRTYTSEPPIPAVVVDPKGEVLFIQADIMAGQETSYQAAARNSRYRPDPGCAFGRVGEDCLCASRAGKSGMAVVSAYTGEFVVDHHVPHRRCGGQADSFPLLIPMKGSVIPI